MWGKELPRSGISVYASYGVVSKVKTRLHKNIMSYIVIVSLHYTEKI